MLSTDLLTQPPEYICFYNAIRDEARRVVTYSDRRTTWCICTRFHRRNKRSWTPSKRHQRGLNNHSYVRKSSARNAPYIHPKYQTACLSSTAWESATQNKHDAKLEFNAAQLQWNSTEARVQQLWWINPETLAPTYTTKQKKCYQRFNNTTWYRRLQMTPLVEVCGREEHTGCESRDEGKSFGKRLCTETSPEPRRFAREDMSHLNRLCN